jgi:hypothetical protein
VHPCQELSTWLEKCDNNAPKPSLFRQLSTWLQKCDNNHKSIEEHSNKDLLTRLLLPTRLLDTEPSHDPSNIRLHVVEKADDYRYLALSHRWAESKELMQRTLKENVEQRMGGFNLDDLPQTFQDAIQVARELGIKYIWIDSLCIIQDDTADWEQESTRMHGIYASAYCTIAATPSPDPNADPSAGFLGRLVPNEGLLLQDELGQVKYVSTNVADFEKDVKHGELSKRAWVMQERCLSSRTIHFTHTQVYGECGEGVCARDNIFLRW